MLAMLALSVACGKGPADESVAVGSASRAASDAIAAPPPTPGLWRPTGEIEGPGREAPVGYLPGGGGVSATGAFTYSLPLDVPPGRAGVQPNLAIEHTGGGHGSVGLGWALSGATSMITRCAKTLDTEGRVDGADYLNGDAYCLDGQKMVVVGHDPSGGVGDELRLAADEIVRIVSDIRVTAANVSAWSGPTEFTVYLKNGRVRTYQVVNRDRMAGTPTGYAPAENVRSAWMLTEERDAIGNAMRFNYVDELDPTTHALGRRLDSIEYTFGLKSEVHTNRKVQLVYEDSPVPLTKWSAGVGSLTTKRLRSIQMFAPRPQAQALVWAYDLRYDAMNRLVMVQKCGFLGRCTWARQFEYGVTPDPRQTELVQYTSQVFPTSGHTYLAQVFDMNGDGLDDVLTERQDPVNPLQSHVFAKVSVANGSSATPLANEVDVTLDLAFVSLDDSRPVDLAGNGHYIYWGSELCQQRPYHWNGAGFVLGGAVGMNAPNFGLNCWDNPFSLAVELVDLDGDGLLDRVGQPQAGGNWAVWRHNDSFFGQGTGFAAPISTSASFFHNQSAVPADLDGDGRGELLAPTVVNGVVSYKSIRLDDDGNVAVLPVSVGKDATFVDLNGDGLKDQFVIEEDESVTIRWNLGSSYRPGPGGGVLEGFGGPFAPNDPALNIFVGSPSTPQFRRALDVGDYNEDGLEDLLFETPAGARILFSHGDGHFDLSGVVAPLRTKSMTGDFNGDGLRDILTFDGNAIEIFYLQPRFRNEIVAVSDQGASQPRERVSYTRTADHDTSPPADAPSCNRPARCVRRGVTAVATHQRWQGEDVGAYTTTEYGFDWPRASVFGQGFLGYGRVRSFDRSTGKEVTTTYDVESRALDRFLFVGLPKTRLEVAPVFNPAQSAQPSTSPAQAVYTTYDYEVTSPTGLTRLVLPHVMDSIAWEETTRGLNNHGVDIDWTLGRWPHVTLVQVPSVERAARHERRTLRHDEYANVTLEEQVIDGGETRVTEKTYAWTSDPQRVDLWQVGLVASVMETSYPAVGAPARRTEEYAYDLAGRRLLASIEPNGGDDEREDISYAYDAFGNVTQEMTTALVDGALETRTLNLGFDADGTFEAVRWVADMGRWQFVHPAYGVVQERMNANGAYEKVVIDDLGRPTRTYDRDELGNAVQRGQVARRPRIGVGIKGVINESWSLLEGSYSAVHSDELGRPTLGLSSGYSTPAAVGGQTPPIDTLVHTALGYDTLGRVVSASRPAFGAPSAVLWQRELDTLNRPVRSIRADGTEVAMSHAYFTTTTVNANHEVKWLRMNVDGQIVESTSLDDAGVPNTVTYTYGAFNRLAEMNAGGRTTSVAYDLRGRVVWSEEPNSGATRIAYDGFGEVREATDTLATRTLVRDALGRVTSLVVQHDGVVDTSTYAYGTQVPVLGKMLSAVSPDGVTSLFGYDGRGRPSRTEVRMGGERFVFEQRFDAAGRVSRLTYPAFDATLQRFSVSSTYQPSGFLAGVTALTDPAAATSATFLPQSLWRADARDAEGRLVTETFGNGLVGTRTYEPLSGRLASDELRDAQSQLLGLESYGYDDEGRLGVREDQDGRHEELVHDALHRLRRWTVAFQGQAQTTEYRYDAEGNLRQVLVDGALVKDNDYGALSPAAPAGPHALTRERLSGATFAYDAVGRMISAPGRTFAWTHFNKPSRIVLAGTATVTYAYDAFGQRVLKRSTSGEEVVSVGLYQRRTAPGQARRHVFTVSSADGAIAEVVVEQSSGGAAQRSMRYLHKGPTGNVRWVTDEQQHVTRYYYEPFGKVIDAYGYPAQSLPLVAGFGLHEHEADTGLIDMGGRVYDPELARFLSPDPVVSSPFDLQSFNRYSYVRNDPMNRADPSGYRDMAMPFQVDGGANYVRGEEPAATDVNSFDDDLLDEATAPEPATDQPSADAQDGRENVQAQADRGTEEQAAPQGDKGGASGSSTGDQGVKEPPMGPSPSDVSRGETQILASASYEAMKKVIMEQLERELASSRAQSAARQAIVESGHAIRGGTTEGIIARGTAAVGTMLERYQKAQRIVTTVTERIGPAIVPLVIAYELVKYGHHVSELVDSGERLTDALEDAAVDRLWEEVDLWEGVIDHLRSFVPAPPPPQAPPKARQPESGGGKPKEAPGEKLQEKQAVPGEQPEVAPRDFPCS